MTEVILILLVIVSWLGYRGYLTLCDYLLERIVLLIHSSMVLYGIMKVFR